MLITSEKTIDDSLEVAYCKAVGPEHRKKYAQFFTPAPVAALMSRWLLRHNDLKTVLEPALGLGIFSRTILAEKDGVNIKGFEVDETIFSQAKGLFEGHRNVSLSLSDYLYDDWENQYDGIICNPPYFKFHDYDNKAAVSEISRRLNCKLNGFTNLYTLFLLKSIYQLKPGGRAAFITPSEFLNSDYGIWVKAFLLKNGALRHIIVIDFEENVFDGALTTACIILCARDSNEGSIQFSGIASLRELKEIEQWIDNYPAHASSTKKSYRSEELDPSIKWRSYYQRQNAVSFKNLVPFANFGKVMRGIATGANQYFTFTPSKAAEYGIPEKYLLPCICKAADVKNPFFTPRHFADLKAGDRPVFLFNAIDEKESKVASYLQKGAREGIHLKHLTAHRNPWYALEQRPPAPIWVSVFNRNGLRFVRNEANTSNLTTFHCIYPNSSNLFSSVNIDLLFAYLLTNTAKRIFEDNRREYGNGLQKFEPNDINSAKMLDLSLLDQKTTEAILKHYQVYRSSVLSGHANEKAVESIDQLFIERYT